MKFITTDYNLLQDDNDAGNVMSAPSSCRYSFSKSTVVVSVSLLFLSLLCNLFLTVQYYRVQGQRHLLPVSEYAGLAYDVPVPFAWVTAYSGHNETLADQLWDALGTEMDVGIVALPDEWTSQKQLPRAQRFPWDEKKGIYLVNGHHNLHCLVNIRRAYIEYTRNLTQTKSSAHITHCLDALRQDIICHADDTPRYTTHTSDPVSGLGQIRQCRSWSRLQEWGRQRSGCYRHISQGQNLSEIERYKFCEEGTRYLPEIRDYFGFNNDWVPPNDERMHGFSEDQILTMDEEDVSGKKIGESE